MTLHWGLELSGVGVDAAQRAAAQGTRCTSHPGIHAAQVAAKFGDDRRFAEARSFHGGSDTAGCAAVNANISRDDLGRWQAPSQQEENQGFQGRVKRNC